ncbi:peripherin-2-like [Argiope bruennichi]|uniref:peripherin-2-like n=1 Tax=Argiope bruennichi TaxID=94029 RepID=UPI002495941B|nr:peripherin-2-like [Argiope bruennichi]
MFLVSFLGIKAAVGGHVVEDASDAKSAAFFFHMYWIAATITVSAILAAAFACFVEIYFLRHGLREGLKAGMEKYKHIPEIKTEIDRLQLDYKCCGVDNYKTWYNISWIDVQYLDTRDPGVAR